MELIEKINNCKQNFVRESFSEDLLSAIVLSKNFSENGISFLAFKNKEFYFEVPKQNWDYDTALKEGENSIIYQSLEKIAKDNKMRVGVGNCGFNLVWPNMGDLSNMGEKEIYLARIGPTLLIFDEKEAYKAGLDTNKKKDKFLKEIVHEVYLKGY